ncbi:MAG: hypothetical protein ACI4AQ_05510 [Lachnospiraceae bacterium]
MKKIDYDELFPTIPEEVSRKIDEVVYEHLSEKTIDFSKNKKRPVTRWAVAAAALCLLVPTGVYAAGKAYHAYVVKKDKYEVGINISMGEKQSPSVDEAESGNAGENLQNQQNGIKKNVDANVGYKDLKLNYVPEDLHYNVDGPYGGKYTTNSPSNDRGMTCVFYKIPAEGMDSVIDYTLESETWETKNGNTAIHLTRAKGYNQLWIAFEGTQYAAQIYVNGFSEDEVKLLADGAELIDGTEECANEWREPEKVSVTSSTPEIRLDSGINLAVGDCYVQPLESAEVTLKSVSVQDNFDGITTDSIGRPTDYSEYLSSDGKIRSVRKCVKIGDGKTELDQVVSSEETVLKVVVLELEIKSLSQQVSEYCVSPRLLENNNGIMKQFARTEDNYAYYREFSYEMFGFSTEHETNKNSLVNLQPQENATVRVCFALDEDCFDNAYIQLVAGKNAFVPLKDLK